MDGVDGKGDAVVEDLSAALLLASEVGEVGVAYEDIPGDLWPSRRDLAHLAGECSSRLIRTVDVAEHGIGHE